jgi:hypothetical protein
MRKAPSITTVPQLKKQRAAKLLRDNPILDRLIEVGTKALRRGLMSGETLRAPRQQLRRLCASAFVLSNKSPAIARLFGARCIFGLFCDSLPEPTRRPAPSRFLLIQKTVRVIRKNLALLAVLCGIEHCGDPCAAFFFGESRVA